MILILKIWDAPWPDVVIALGTLVYATLTIVLAIAAIRAARAALTQLRILERQNAQTEEAHREEMDELRRSREAALRPFLTVVNVSLYTDRLVAEVRNIGPGPAIQIRLRGWLLPRAPDNDDQVEAARFQELAEQDAHFNGIVPAIAPGASYPLRWPPSVRRELSSVAAALFVLEYEDVFGNQFPAPGQAGQFVPVADTGESWLTSSVSHRG